MKTEKKHLSLKKMKDLTLNCIENKIISIVNNNNRKNENYKNKPLLIQLLARDKRGNLYSIK